MIANNSLTGTPKGAPLFHTQTTREPHHLVLVPPVLFAPLFRMSPIHFHRNMCCCAGHVSTSQGRSSVTDHAQAAAPAASCYTVDGTKGSTETAEPKTRAGNCHKINGWGKTTHREQARSTHSSTKAQSLVVCFRGRCRQSLTPRPANAASAAIQPTAGLSAFAFGCMPSMLVLQQLAANDAAAPSTSYLPPPHHAGEPHGPNILRSNDLSAQGAAEVLFTIAKSESGDGSGGCDAGRNMYIASGIPAEHMHDTSGQVLAAISGGPKCDPTASRRDSHTLQAGGGGEGNHDGVVEDEEEAVTGQDTADGVPVDALGRSMQVMMPWSDGAGDGAPGGILQMVMTPHGLMPLMQGGQPFLMPVQTIKGADGEDMTVAVHGMRSCTPPSGEAVGMVLVPDAASPPGAPLIMNEDGTGFVLVGAERQGEACQMSVLRVGTGTEAGMGGMACSVALVQPQPGMLGRCSPVLHIARVDPNCPRFAGLLVWDPVNSRLVPRHTHALFVRPCFLAFCACSLSGRGDMRRFLWQHCVPVVLQKQMRVLFCSISEEDFMSAMRMATAVEVSSTS
jgi:hypothetical protein